MYDLRWSAAKESATNLQRDSAKVRLSLAKFSHETEETGQEKEALEDHVRRRGHTTATRSSNLKTPRLLHRLQRSYCQQPGLGKLLKKCKELRMTPFSP